MAGHGLGHLVPDPLQSIDDVSKSSPECNEIRSGDDEFRCSPENLKLRLFTQV